MLVLTLAYDNKMRVYDSKSCQLLSIVSNESGHAFSCQEQVGNWTMRVERAPWGGGVR